MELLDTAIRNDCPCSFKRWSSLRSHLSRYHLEISSPATPQTHFFTCLVCDTPDFPIEKDYFEHIGHRLKNSETVKSVFAGCNHQTNIYGTFATHKHQKLTPHTSQDFKPDIIIQRQTSKLQETMDIEPSEEDGQSAANYVSSINAQYGENDGCSVVIEDIATLLLKW